MVNNFSLLLNSGDYIGQKLRENAFDPKGKGTSTVLDDLVKTTWMADIWCTCSFSDCVLGNVSGSLWSCHQRCPVVVGQRRGTSRPGQPHRVSNFLSRLLCTSLLEQYPNCIWKENKNKKTTHLRTCHVTICVRYGVLVSLCFSPRTTDHLAV